MKFGLLTCLFRPDSPRLRTLCRERRSVRISSSDRRNFRVAECFTPRFLGVACPLRRHIRCDI
eukprot:1458636-Prymnesium_polylepis.1